MEATPESSSAANMTTTEHICGEVSTKLREEVLDTRAKLLAYCKANNWAGYDPYDALNSKLFQALPILNSRIPRLVLTQMLKRSPLNFRRLLGVPKTQNPKALALFLESFVMSAAQGSNTERDLARQMIERLIALRSPGIVYWCWGYSFPWQGRSILVPAHAPNLVCTTFVASALATAYEQLGDERCLTMALSAAEYLLNELYWTDGEEAGFSYPLPSLRTRVHNANLLAAALLCRLAKHTGEEKLLEPALKAARYSVSKQRPDGSWWYGEGPTQRWIDNFHTGYNLCALRSIGCTLGTTEFEMPVERGLAFYKAHFFCEDGAPRYFHNRTYPIDIHCVAQSLLTLCDFGDSDASNRELAARVFAWTKKHMWDGLGFFYYRVQPFGAIRTSYMRWSQAWMLLALSELSNTTNANDRQSKTVGAQA